ncbi:helix-turn-helix domain-containing protein [Candidatus Uabimicrobium amorphum]|uniref:helix-turn-helix domain-containing protein n=1 Tax=Uabimicrobium amorphum TaxID=2596890 RepID=UPI0015634A23|nr:helix-turn-helix domain-containing protein [Candidatus Uabimicrobium amorphum]
MDKDILEVILDKVENIESLLKQKEYNDRFMDVRSVARVLKRSEGTIRRLIQEGKIEGFKIGSGNKQSRYLIPKTFIDNLINQGKGFIE